MSDQDDGGAVIVGFVIVAGCIYVAGKMIGAAFGSSDTSPQMPAVQEQSSVEPVMAEQPSVPHASSPRQECGTAGCWNSVSGNACGYCDSCAGHEHCGGCGSCGQSFGTCLICC